MSDRRPTEQPRYKRSTRFTIDGDIRYISHQDTMRLMARALQRARVPVRFSGGYHPRPRLSLPLPRPVGVASNDELMLVELTEPMPAAELAERLARQVPAGISITAAEELSPRCSVATEWVRYQLPLPQHRRQALREQIELLMSRLDGRVQSASTDERYRRLGSAVEALWLGPDGLAMQLRTPPSGSIRPTELLELLGLAEQDYAGRIRRTCVGWVYSQEKDRTSGSDAR